MSTLRLQSWATNRGPTRYTVNLDGVHQANDAERNKGVHFDRAEAQQLRALAEYLMRGFVGAHGRTVEMIMAKVPR